MTQATVKNEMHAIDTRNHKWLDGLSEEDRKKVLGSLWVMSRYCSAVESRVSDIDEHYLIMTNELVNVHSNALRHHPELQFRLMQTVGIGKSMYHPWIAPGKGNKNKTTKLEKWLLEVYPDWNDDELALVVNNNTEADFVQMMEDSGMSDKEIKDIFKKKPATKKKKK